MKLDPLVFALIKRGSAIEHVLLDELEKDPDDVRREEIVEARRGFLAVANETVRYTGNLL